MDKEKRIWLRGRYIDIKISYIVLQIFYTLYFALYFKGDNYDSLLRYITLLLAVISGSGIYLACNYNKDRHSFCTSELATLIAMGFVLLYAAIIGISIKDTFPGKGDNYTNKLENLESNNSLYQEVLPSVPSIDYEFLSTVNETVDKNNVTMNSYSTIQNESKNENVAMSSYTDIQHENINKYAILKNHLTGKTKYLRKKAFKNINSLENLPELTNSLYEEILPGVPFIDYYEFLSTTSNELINKNNVAMKAYSAIQNKAIKEKAITPIQLIGIYIYLRKRAIDYINSLRNYSVIINSLNEEVLPGETEVDSEFPSTAQKEIVNEYSGTMNIHSTTQNETIHEYVTESISTTQHSSHLSEDFTCKSVNKCFWFPSVFSLFFQLLFVIVTFQYWEVFKGHGNKMRATYRRLNEIEGEVKLDLSSENPQNDLEAGPSQEKSDE